jgi:hypothetical protein
MIKRSALPKGIITKILGDTIPLRTLAGCSSQCKTSDCQSLIRTGAHQPTKVIVLDNDNIKYNIILGTTLQDWNKVELLRRKHGMV